MSYSIVLFTCVPFSVSVIYSSGKTESRGKEEGGGVGSIGEANNWGMDDSIDVNAVRSQRQSARRPNRRHVFIHAYDVTLFRTTPIALQKPLCCRYFSAATHCSAVTWLYWTLRQFSKGRRMRLYLGVTLQELQH